MQRRLLLTLLAPAAALALATFVMAETDGRPGRDEQPVDSATSPGGVASSGAEPSSARVKVEVNHCFVEPVSFDGEQWNVPYSRQFGWGGMQPEGWEGAGVMMRVGEDEARFEDDGGVTIVFRSVDDPSVRPVENASCD